MTAILLVAAIALASSASRAADPAATPIPTDPQFRIDPVFDIVLTGATAGAAGLTQLILSTGEITPQPIAPGGADRVLSFDRVAITQTINPNAGLYSNIGIGAALGFAVLDPILSGVNRGWNAAIVDGVMYAESLTLTLFLTGVTKIAVRRPRPLDYKNPPEAGTNTDLVLSFFSGHAAATATITATATYLAFVRSPHTARPWITLGAGALLTAFVSYERVRSGMHFPTDVIAGSMAGAAFGVLVPHVHRRRAENLDLWIGFAPAPGGGGGVQMQGLF